MNGSKPKLTMVCGKCQGCGTVPRQTDLHLTTAPRETCDRCGGGGRVPLDPDRVQEALASHADQHSAGASRSFWNKAHRGSPYGVAG